MTRTEPVRVSICHCLACQKRTGSVFGAQARFSRQGAEIEGRSTEYIRTGDEGSRISYRFCPVCAATVYYTVEGYDVDHIAIPVGAFADPGFPAPGFSVYEDRRHPWVGLPAAVERTP